MRTHGADRGAPIVGGEGSAEVADPLGEALAQARTVFIPTRERLLARYPDLTSGEDALFLGVAVPLVVSPGQEPTGAIGFAFEAGQTLGREHRVVAELVAGQCAQALERARLYDREHRFAETLQRTLLPGDLPSTGGIDCAVRYLPAAEQRAVGGDWYDVIALEGDRVGLAVGDVAGHGQAAATAMGQMRNALRALAATFQSPAATLEAFNRFVCGQLPEEMATVVLGILDPDAGTLTYANAGHLPPVLLRPDGKPRFLEDALEPPVGVDAETRYRDEVETVDARCRLVIYTDGLVERRHESIDRGLERLAAATSVDEPDPEALCEHLVLRLLTHVSLEDDAAVLVASLSYELGHGADGGRRRAADAVVRPRSIHRLRGSPDTSQGRIPRARGAPDVLSARAGADRAR